MTKKQLLKNLSENTYCRIQPSKISGVGVFAIFEIPKGTNPFLGSCDHSYITLSEKDLSGLDSKIRKIITDFFIVRDGKAYVPSCAFNGVDISYYMNYSDNPNIEAEKNGDSFRAVRDIAEGEELTINYGKSYKEDTLHF